MKPIAFTVVLAGLVLLPAASAAQSAGSSDPPRRTSTREVQARPPLWGFAIGMRPGPNNSFTHPFVHTVVPGSNAARAGIRVGDVILSVNGRDTRQPPLFLVREPGTRYVLRVRRDAEELELTFVYPEPPAERRRR